MANTRSALKSIRVSGRKAKRNTNTRRKYRLATREVNDLVAEGKTAEAKKALGKAFSEIDKAARKNVIHKNAAARYKSRLAKSVDSSKEKKS